MSNEQRRSNVAATSNVRVRKRPPAELDAPVGSAPWKGVAHRNRPPEEVRSSAAGSWQAETATSHAVRKRPREEARPTAAGPWQAEPAATRKRPPAEARPAEHTRPADRPAVAAGRGDKRISGQSGAAPCVVWGAFPEPQPLACADPRWGHGLAALEEAARYAPAEARPAEHALPLLKETPHYGDRSCTKFRHWLIPTVHSGLQHAACKYRGCYRAL